MPRRRREDPGVGCIHGNEPAGRGIVDDLVRSSPAPERSCCSCATSTPTASPHQRRNAHGVDLNRNSPEHWAGAGRAAVVGARDARDPRPHPARAARAQHLLPPALRPGRRPRGRPPAGRPQVLGAHRPPAAAPEPAPGQHLALAERTRAARLGLRRRAGARAPAGRPAPAPRRRGAGGASSLIGRARRARPAPAARGARRAGRYQFQSPMIFITAGTSTARTSVASSRIAAEGRGRTPAARRSCRR